MDPDETVHVVLTSSYNYVPTGMSRDANTGTLAQKWLSAVCAEPLHLGVSSEITWVPITNLMSSPSMGKTAAR
jgi:hypothetical protein